MMPVILVCDEGPAVGLGHRRRCEAIASALREYGFESAIVASTRGVVAAPVIIVDSYRVRADDRSRFVPDVVVAIDDLGRDLAVDLVVLPAPGASGSSYRNARDVLAGAAYSLVNLAAPARERTIGDGRLRVLVTMGASDSAGIGQRIASEIAAAAPRLLTQLVLGPWGDTATPSGVVRIDGSRGIEDALSTADVVVTAGGVTLLESLALGRPTIVVETAANQRSNISSVIAAGAAMHCDVGSAALGAIALVGDSSARNSLALRGPQLIDGRGASRVAQAIAALVHSPVGRAPIAIGSGAHA